MNYFIFFAFLFSCFTCYAQVKRYDVIIDEIMADPAPQVSLPNSEYIELKNVSPNPVNLAGWKLEKSNASAIITADFLLKPDSLVILCSNAAVLSLSVYGRTIGVSSFPSLGNEGDLISLVARSGQVIHALQYEKTWFNNNVKGNGGWSLEMVDTNSPCSGESNWKASADEAGGSPGKENSVHALNPDIGIPQLTNHYLRNTNELILEFSEPLDSAYAITRPFSMAEMISYSVALQPPLFNSILVTPSNSFERNKIYALQVPDVKDCAGNLSVPGIVKVGLSSVPAKHQVVINEILFNPKPAGVDYVELYNNSSSTIDLQSLRLANRSLTGILSTPLQISTRPRMLYPSDYFVLTEDEKIIQQFYPTATSLVHVSSLPSLPDASGNLVLLNSTGEVIDEIIYDEQWHFKLLNNHDGIALERIDFNKPGKDPSNWHSAAGTAGYGTPGYRNSQMYLSEAAEEMFHLPRDVLSPDNNGFEDYLVINYKFPEPGYVTNITAFDVEGRVVKLISRNALCATSGYFRWDGLDDTSTQLRQGIYILLIEYFNLQGKKGRIKKVVSLLRDF